jgi:hypothetical protein
LLFLGQFYHDYKNSPPGDNWQRVFELDECRGEEKGEVLDHRLAALDNSNEEENDSHNKEDMNEATNSI